jgi:hypothetical protein
VAQLRVAQLTARLQAARGTRTVRSLSRLLPAKAYSKSRRPGVKAMAAPSTKAV